VKMTIDVDKIGSVLNDGNARMSERFRALFMLKNIGGKTAIDYILNCLGGESDLLNHELAYVLGQINKDYALPKLSELVRSREVSTITRHEAAEAIGSIGNIESLALLLEFSNDPDVIVAETCQLAVDRIRWLSSNEYDEALVKNPFNTVDPSPASTSTNTHELTKVFLDSKATLFDRYRAMFSLRNLNTDDAAKTLTKGFECPGSVLFQHEVAYVLGQMQKSVVVPELSAQLLNLNINPIIRHECAEALGGIANEDCRKVLEEFRNDKSRVVRESCEVALDMLDYENSDEFQYS
uniref:Deoxyhypusine hydroxylase n=1 Tax=Ciona savignyi TaxID=51511 RepID=H2Z404_CIOSA